MTEPITAPTAFNPVATNNHQDKALALKADYRDKAAKITNDQHLTPQGRAEKLTALKEQTRAGLAAIQAEQQQATQIRTGELTAKLLDRNPSEGNDPALAMSYRDAAVQVSRIEDQRTATALMKQALRNQDTPLEKSILRVAFEQRWPDPINTYTAARPRNYNTAEELWTLTEPNTHTTDLVDAFAYNLEG